MTPGENLRGTERAGTGVIRETAEPFEYFVEFLTVKHVPQLASLQHVILEVAPKPLPLYVRDEPFFAKCASECGCVVGAWHGDRLIGYAVLYVPRHGEENYGTDLGLPDDELRYVGHLAGSGVEPLYRGNKIQSLLVDARAVFAESAGYYHVCGGSAASRMANALLNASSASLYLPFSRRTTPIPFKVGARFGCSGPRAFSEIFKAR